MDEERGPVVGPDRELPLSPELVLVAPELGEHALAKERNGRTPPAAAQAPVLPAGAPPAPPPAEAPPADAPSAGAPSAEEPPAEAAPAPPTAADIGPAPAEPPARWRLTVGGAVVILLGALVVLGGGFLIARSVLSGSSTPSVEPATRDAPPAETAPAAATQPSRAPRAPVVAAPKPQQRAQPRARPKPKSTPAPTPKPASAAPARAPEPTPATVRPTSGGYVLPGGRFQVSSNRRTIVGFTLATKCVDQVTLPPIPIETTGAFTFAGHPTGAPSATTVRVKGTFTSPTEARGKTQVLGTTCSAPATSFVARLS